MFTPCLVLSSTNPESGSLTDWNPDNCIRLVRHGHGISQALQWIEKKPARRRRSSLKGTQEMTEEIPAMTHLAANRFTGAASLPRRRLSTADRVSPLANLSTVFRRLFGL